jgi:SAM-dependent methyltransferase
MISRVSTSVRTHLGRLQRMRGYRAEIELQYAATEVEITRGVPCIAGVKNVGDQTWRCDGWYRVALSYHWRRGGEVIEGLRTPLPADVHPGEQAVLQCTVMAPAEPGDYRLAFDLVRENVGWFSDHGSSAVTIERTARDYDYDTAYAKVDLDQDYWSIVGPATREHFEHLGRQKRQTLIDLGMTPHSRVLDVGCGTGQLSEALVEYLAGDGLYYGTDIVRAAVEFCERKFQRPNFFFRQNGMTGVPVVGQQFDLILLSSVFTHMYPLEIQAMLVDLKRLLAPAGVILADVFVTPHTQTSAGSRSKVEINEGYLKGLFAQTGLTHELQGCTVQPAGGKRLGFVFRHGRTHETRES